MRAYIGTNLCIPLFQIIVFYARIWAEKYIYGRPIMTLHKSVYLSVQ
jgi:hypothetical protein